MKIEELKPAMKKKTSNRVGRGIGSGNGKTYIEDYQKEDLQIFTQKHIQK